MDVEFKWGLEWVAFRFSNFGTTLEKNTENGVRFIKYKFRYDTIHLNMEDFLNLYR